METGANPQFDKVKRFLEGGPAQGWIFGVCATLARRTGWDLWAVRLVAAISALMFTVVTALAYFVMAMLLDETRPGAQRKLSRWARQLDSFVDLIWRGLKKFFADRPGRERDYETNGQYYGSN